jgi:DivIVA domain-containing protein
MTHKRFPRTSRWRRGYHRKQVDAFLSTVEVSLQGNFPPIAASEIRRAGFELVHHGYRVEAVDAHLDDLEERVLVTESAAGGRRGLTDPDSDVQFLRDQLDEPHMHRFPRSRMLRRGYDLDEVDEFVDHVLARMDALKDSREIGDGELTVEVVRRVGFKPRRGGYAEEAVDETLDRVVEMLLVQRRAADGAWTGLSPGSDVEAAGPTM